MAGWIKVTEDMPPYERKMWNCSIDVRIKTVKNHQYLGFYHEGEAEWYYYQDVSRIKKLTEEVKEWRYL